MKVPLSSLNKFLRPHTNGDYQSMYISSKNRNETHHEIVLFLFLQKRKSNPHLIWHIKGTTTPSPLSTIAGKIKFKLNLR